MANREKGEVDLDVAGTTYTLVLNTNAIVTLETLLSTPEKQVSFGDVLDALSKPQPPMTYVRGFVWACLRKYHKAVTIEQAGELLDQIGADVFAAAMFEVKRSAVPDAEDAAKTTDRPQTPRRVRGTGAAATSTHGASA